MIKRFVLVGSAALAATLGLVMPVHADYPPGGSTVVTDKPTYTPSSPVTVSADVCPAGQGLEVTFTITPPGGGAAIVLHATADGSGHAETQYTPTVAGSYSVEATLPDAQCSPSDTTFGVEAPLPATGSNSQQWILTATALVITGAGFTVVALRRRRHAAA